MFANRNNLFLPGTDRQIALFLDFTDPSDKSVLIIGAGTEKIAEIFLLRNAAEVYIITDDEESLIHTRITLPTERKNIFVRLMDYDNTDFRSEKFDVVYSQGSTGTKQRNKIIKEIKRILKPDGYLCVGEIISKAEEEPAFVRNIWNENGLLPLSEKDFTKYYTDKSFELLHEEDLSYTLKEFYLMANSIAESGSENFSAMELKHYKKILKKIKHESDVYLKLGGDKFIGYNMLVLKRNDG